MSAEDRAAQRRIPDDQFKEILRVIRETIRAEMRAEREASRDIDTDPARWRKVIGAILVAITQRPSELKGT